MRWLRPEFQAPASAPGRVQTTLAGTEYAAPVALKTSAAHAWPATLPEQLAAVASVLADSPAAQSQAQLAARFTGKGRWKSRLPGILEALGRARPRDAGWVAG